MPMTWKEFKEEVEKSGVGDNFEVQYIDISWPDYKTIKVEIETEPRLQFKVWDVI